MEEVGHVCELVGGAMFHKSVPRDPQAKQPLHPPWEIQHSTEADGLWAVASLDEQVERRRRGRQMSYRLRGWLAIGGAIHWPQVCTWHTLPNAMGVGGGGANGVENFHGAVCTAGGFQDPLKCVVGSVFCWCVLCPNQGNDKA